MKVPTRAKAVLALVGAAVVAGVALTNQVTHDLQNTSATSAADQGASAGASAAVSAAASAAASSAAASALSSGAASSTQSAGAPGSAATAVPASTTSDPGSIVVVLDTSRSMRQSTPGGTTRMDEAKRALEAAIDAMPASAKVGLRVFGSTVPVTDPMHPSADACRDSRRILPVAPLDKTRLKAAVDVFSPYGYHPTSYALQQAAADLGPSGKRTIILVSDGGESCAADPAATARALRASGIDLTISTVGLHTDATASRQLEQVAAAGGGSYRQVSSARGVQTGVQHIVDRAQGRAPAAEPTSDSAAVAAGTPVPGGATGTSTTSGSDGATQAQAQAQPTAPGTSGRAAAGATSTQQGTSVEGWNDQGTVLAQGTQQRTTSRSTFGSTPGSSSGSGIAPAGQESPHQVTSSDPGTSRTLPAGFVTALLLLFLFFWLKDHD